MKPTFLTILLVLLCAIPSLGGTITVPIGANVGQVVGGAASGDELVFADGTYTVNSSVTVSKDITLRAANRHKANFVAANGVFSFKVTNNAHPTFDGLYFDGSGITYEGKAGGLVDGCRFVNFQRGVNVGFGSGTALGNHNNGFDPQNWTVQNCTFDGSGDVYGGWGIGFWRGNNVLIAHNEAINVGNFVKSNNGGSTATNIVIRNNYLTGIRRMNSETQGQVDGYKLLFNYVEKTRMSGNYQDNINCLGWSGIYHGDETRNVEVAYNVWDEFNNQPDGTGVRIGHETGNKAHVHNNIVIGVGTAFPVFNGDTSGNRTEAEIGTNEANGVTVVENNQLIQVKHGQGYGYGQYGSKVIFRNNNANVKTKYTKEQIRSVTGPYRADFPDGAPPVTQPTTQPTPSSFSITGSPVKPSPGLLTQGASVDFTVSDVPAGSKQLRFEPRATGAPTLVAPTAGFNVTVDVPASRKVTIAGARWAWLLDYRCVALDASGNTIGSTTWVSIARVDGIEGDPPDAAKLTPGYSGSKWPDALKPPTTKPTDPPATNPTTIVTEMKAIVPYGSAGLTFDLTLVITTDSSGKVISVRAK